MTNEQPDDPRITAMLERLDTAERGLATIQRRFDQDPMLSATAAGRMPILDPRYTFAELPKTPEEGMQAYCIDCERQGFDTGTGIPVFADADGVWRRKSDDSIATILVSTALPANFVFEFLEDAANGDTIEMNVNGSVTPANYDYVVATDKVFDLSRINLTTSDDAKHDVDGFFSIAALSTGLVIQILDTNGTTVLQNFDTDDAPIKAHADLIALAGIDVDDDSAGNVSVGSARWSIFKTGALMRLTAAQRVRVIVGDNLSGLVQLRIMVQGMIKDA